MSILVNHDAADDVTLTGHQLGLKQISEELNISYECVHVNLYVRKNSAKRITKCWNFDQRHARVEASHSCCAWFRNDVDFLSSIVTMDEATWMHLEIKQQ